MSGIGIMTTALVVAAVFAGPVRAQVNGPVPGPYGAEDGYNDDGFGWGPAFRRETNFRPAYGFYGGVERPYPYARNQVGRVGQDDVVARPRRIRRTTRHLRHAARHTSGLRQARRGSRSE